MTAAQLHLTRAGARRGSCPSRAEIEMTNPLPDALKLIEVTLHDHPIVTATDAFSFPEKGLLQAP